MIIRNRPYLDSTEILAALRPDSGRSEFEFAVADRLGVSYAIAFAYGHAGFIATLRALGLAEIDVVLPAYTCAVMADAVVTSGNRPVFVDIDLTDYNMNLEAMKAALTPQTRVIVATHMYGYPIDVDAVRKAADDKQVLIVEDRALGFPKSTSETFGLQGDVALFSFGKGKQLFSIEGGIIATNSTKLYEKIKAYRDQEMADLPITLWLRRWMRFFLSYSRFGKFISPHFIQNKLKRGQPSLHNSPTPEAVSTLMVEDYYATAYADFQARIGLSQLRKADFILNRRQKLAKFYNSRLRDIPGLTPAPIIPGSTYSHYVVRVKQRDEIGFVRQMRDRGIDVGNGWGYVLPVLERFRSYAKDRYPNTEQVTREIVNLPLHTKIKMSEAQYIVECTRDILRQS